MSNTASNQSNPGTKDKESKKASAKDVAAPKKMTREELIAQHKRQAESKDVVTSDVVGYWNSDGDIPLTGILQVEVVAVDSSIDKKKSSLLCKVKATLPTEIADSEGNNDICAEGDLVGFWYKPGMRDLRKLGGLEVTITRDEKLDKDTGKGNPMKGFQIRADGTGRALRITEDRREKSKNTETVFDVNQPPANAPPNAPVYDDENRLSF